MFRPNVQELPRLTIYRQLLGGRRDTPIAILRGEVGSSMVKTRIIQARLILVKSILEGENTLLKQVLDVILRIGKGWWHKTLIGYLGDVGLTIEDLNRMDRSEIKLKISK